MKISINIRIKILSLFFIPLLLQANSDQIKFEHLSINDGLSQNTALSIFQDKKGFLWFATQDGLNKYDGYHFTIYKKGFEQNRKLSSVWIADISEDHKGNILLATRVGFDIINVHNESISFLMNDPNDPNSLSNEHGTSVIECKFDSIYEIFVGTVDGLNLFNKKDQNFEIFKNNPKNPNSISNNYIKSLYQDDNQNLWIGTNYGLNLYNKEGKIFTRFINDHKSIEKNQINTITGDKHGNLLIGTGNGLYIFLTGSKKFIPYYLYYEIDKLFPMEIPINSILNDNGKSIWVGTSDGLYIIEISTGKTSKYYRNNNNPNSLSANYIYDIFKDKDGSFWVGTYSGGLNIYHSKKKKFTTYRNNSKINNTLNNNDVLSIYEDDKNILWIGTHGSGLNRFDRTNKQFTYYINDPKNPNSLIHNYVRCITEDKNGLLWLGTDGGGISVYNKQKKEFTNYKHIPGNPNSLSNNKIRTIKEDSEGIIWIGTSGGGLNQFDKRTNTFKHFLHNPDNPKSISCDYIYNIYIDERDNIWIGSDGGGLIKFDKVNKLFTSYMHDPNNPYSICNNFALCVHKSPNGVLWVGTDIGLTMFNIKENKFYTQIKKTILPNTMIYGILEDNHQNLWMSSNEGIIRFNYSNGFLNKYDVNDGIQSNEFWGNSYFKNKKGEFFFGGIDGFTTFFPDSVSSGYAVPPVYLTGLSINNQIIYIGEHSDGRTILNESINNAKKITLNYLDRSFSINYVAPNYINPEKTKYAYKMEGFDLDWHYVNNTKFAGYTNLPPGKYTFKIKATNGEKKWSKITSIAIKMMPPFWKTWWFISSILITIVGFALYWYLNRLYQIKKQNIILEQKVKERTSEILKQKEKIENTNRILKSQKEKLATQRDALIEANNTKDKFFSIISHDLKSPFNALLGFSEILTDNFSVLSKDKIEKYTERIFISAKHLYNLVDNLLSWSRAKRGKIKSYPEKLNLLKTIELTASLSRITAEKKQIEICLKIDPTINIYADENLVSATIRNLLSNAIKYSVKNSTIEISSKTNNKFIEVSISDTGIGIKQKDLKKLFREDVHYTTPGTDDEKGTGLGLILCKEFVEQNNGKIWVDSELGKGTTFTFTIPLKESF